MKNKCQEYKNSLSGALEYEGPVKNPNYFVGFLKIKKDPKVEQLNIENFIPRGSIIRKGEWLKILINFFFIYILGFLAWLYLQEKTLKLS